jgi:hypothetical protein
MRSPYRAAARERDRESADEGTFDKEALVVVAIVMTLVLLVIFNRFCERQSAAPPVPTPVEVSPPHHVGANVAARRSR